MAKLTIHDIQGKEVDSIELPETFDQAVNQDVIHQAIVMYQANLRQGTVSTKDRSEVSGGGKKPWRQKGTGRARAGSSRSPLWHKGGVAFGPHPRDFGYTVPKKIRTAALRETLNAKLKENDLLCVDHVSVDSGKTKDFIKILTNLKLKGKILALLDGSDDKVLLASRNVPFMNFQRASDVNALDVLKNKKLFTTKEAVEKLLKRI